MTMARKPESPDPVTEAHAVPQQGLDAWPASTEHLPAEEAASIAEQLEPPVLRRVFRDTTSWLASAVAHAILIVILARLMLTPPVPQTQQALRVSPHDAELDDQVEAFRDDAEAPVRVDAERTLARGGAIEIQKALEIVSPDEAAAVTDAAPAQDFATRIAPRSGLLQQIGSLTAGELQGRSGAARATLLERGGGTGASEEAVAKGLVWLAKHQLANGSWSLDHQGGSCESRCPDPGVALSPNGATALALLPFLGADETHTRGQYQENVRAGVDYLLRSMQQSRNGGSLHDLGGTMYAHGLGAIVLCEAFAMTKDPKLAQPAQDALDFISYAQDPVGGGWRYVLQSRGDTSVVGWQVMALKSGHMAYLNVPNRTITRAKRFLDRVQVDRGSAYGYMGPGSKPATSAIGLLCRMHLGWKRDRAALRRGVETIARRGPSQTNFYYNYYAMQVMFHFTGGQGEMWAKWNNALRDYLVETQADVGHTEGSWYAGLGHSSIAGGRLYCTAMSTMTLEVYYRHLPIYRQAAVDADFPD